MHDLLSVGCDKKSVQDFLNGKLKQIRFAIDYDIDIDDSQEDFDESLKKSTLKETWEGEDIIDDLVDRAQSFMDDGHDAQEAIERAIDDGLIYTDDIWNLGKHYMSISD